MKRKNPFEYLLSYWVKVKERGVYIRFFFISAALTKSFDQVRRKVEIEKGRKGGKEINTTEVQ